MKMDSLSHLCRCCLSPDADVSLLKEDQNLKEQFLETTSIEVGNFLINNTLNCFLVCRYYFYTPPSIYHLLTCLQCPQKIISDISRRLRLSRMCPRNLIFVFLAICKLIRHDNSLW